MSGFNGSGTFVISAVGLPYAAGTVINQTVANQLNTDLAAGLSACITKDGQTTVTADIPMNSHKLTGLGGATASTDAVNMSQLQSGASLLLSGVSGTDTITGSLTPALGAYVAGGTYRFVSVGANTGAVVLSINGLGNKAITKNGTTALAAGDIISGALVTVTYDGTQFQLDNVSQFVSATITNLTASSISVSSAFTASGGVVIDGKISLGSSTSSTNNGVAYIANGAQSHTTLSGPVAVTEFTSIALTDGTGFPTGGGNIIIDNEWITYATRAGNTLSTLTRNVNGTGITAHSSGAAVSSLTFPSTTLAADLTSTDTTSMTVASQANFPTVGTVLIGTEEIAYTGKSTSPDRLTGLTRGVNGSKAAAHSTSAAVTGNQLLVSSSGYTYDQSTKQLQADNISARLNLSGAAVVPTGSTIPVDGFYKPAANTIALATNGIQAWRVDVNGYQISDLANYALIQSASWASTSGTSHDWTGIPSWAKKITVSLNGVSASNSDNLIIQIGHTTPDTASYSTVTNTFNNSPSAVTTGTTGFYLMNANANASAWTGTVQLTNITGNTWVCSGVIVNSGGSVSIFGGSHTIASALDIVRITWSGSNTFDAGTISILVE